MYQNYRVLVFQQSRILLDLEWFSLSRDYFAGEKTVLLTHEWGLRTTYAASQTEIAIIAWFYKLSSTVHVDKF